MLFDPVDLETEEMSDMYIFTDFVMCTWDENDVINISVTKIVRNWCFFFRNFFQQTFQYLHKRCSVRQLFQLG